MAIFTFLFQPITYIFEESLVNLDINVLLVSE